MNVSIPQVAAFDLGSILKNINSENLNSLAHDENVQKISQNAKGFVESFASDPANKASIDTIKNSVSDKLAGSAFDLSNLINQLSNLNSQNSGSVSNIVNEFITGMSGSGTALTPTELGTQLANFLVTVYIRNLMGPTLTNDQIVALAVEFIGNITNHNQQIVDYVQQTLPNLISQMSSYLTPTDILSIISSGLDFAKFLNNNSTTNNSTNGTDINTLLNIILETFISKDISTLQNYISNLNSAQLQQLLSLLNDPSAFSNWLRQLDLGSIKQLADILNNSDQLTQVLNLFNSDTRLQAIGTIISEILKSSQFQQILALLGDGDLANLINSFNSTSNILDILMGINATEWQLLISILNNPTELQNLLTLFNNTAIQQILNLINNSPQIKQLLSMIDLNQLQKIIKILNLSINFNGTLNLYITTDLQNILAEFVDLRSLAQLMRNFSATDLVNFLETLNIGVLDDLLGMFNVSQLAELHLEQYIPQLIEEIAAANSTMEVVDIIKQTILTHLAYFLNDTSILNSTNPWISILQNALQMIEQNQQLLSMIESYLGGLDLTKINSLLTMLNNFDWQNLADLIPMNFLNLIGELTSINNLNDLFALFNITIPSWAQNYVQNFLPQLISNLLQASTPAEMIQILENNLLAELATVFNDSSLLNSSNPWMRIIQDALNMALSDSQFLSTIEQFVQQYIQGFNITQLDEIIQFLMTLDSDNLGTLIPQEILALVERFVAAQNIGDLLSIFNITLPDWAERFVDSYLPQLISELSQANSTDEMATIIEQAILYQVSISLNDSSILTSPNPWRQVVIDAYYMLMNDPAFLAELQSLFGQFNISEIEMAILENLLQHFPSFYKDILLTIFTTENINYFISFYNITLPPVLSDHLAEYLPQLIAQLVNANSTDQMIQIIESSLLTNLAYMFNDSNILTDPGFYITRDVFYVIRDDPSLLDPLELDPMIRNLTIDFLSYYFATGNMKDAFNNVSTEVATVAATVLADPLNTLVSEYAPDLYQELANSTSEEQSKSIIGDYLVALVRSVFPQMTTTTTTTTTSTTTSTTTTSTTTTTTTTTSTTTTSTTTTSTTTTTRPTTTTTTTRPTTTTTSTTTTTTTTKPTTTTTRTTVTQTLNTGINNIISSLQSRATTLTAATKTLQPLKTIIFVKK